jgi:hypothetical protein
VTGYRTYNREPGHLARTEACQDALGLSLPALEVLVAVLSFERCYGEGPTRAHLYRFLGVTDLHLRELVGGRWLTDETETRTLTGRARAWNTLGFRRDERLAS